MSKQSESSDNHEQGNSSLGVVSNCLLAEKIILALNDYGRRTNSLLYGLPIDPDTKDFKDSRPQEMLKIVIDILNDCQRP